VPEPDDGAVTDDPPADEAAAESAAAVEAPPEEPAPQRRPEQQELADAIQAALGDVIVESTPVFDDIVVRVKPEAWRRVATVAKEQLDCDYLSFISAIDWAPAPREGGEEGGDASAPVQPTEMTFGAAGSAGRFQVFAHVQSTRRHWGATFKTDVDEATPRVESWVPVYAGADWHERECWEMYGVVFDGHPSLRHLYLPSAFEGHPGRKDFPLLARVVKPWPGLVDVEPMPGDATTSAAESEAVEPAGESDGGGDA